MTLYILDPNLAHERGHHLDWNMSVARAARQSGENVVIFAHKDFRVAGSDGIAIQRWFTRSCYDVRDRDPITGAFEDFRFFNDQLGDDLARLPRHRFKSRDAVWMPTLNEKHLMGFIDWIKGFDVARAPLFVVHLMFPSGLSVNAGDATVRIVDPMQALFYGLAFKRATEPGPGVLFFAGGRQLALEFSALSGLPIEPHPIPLCPPPRAVARARTSPRTVLLYSGDLKSDKGFALVPDVADRLCASFPAWNFLVHVNPDSGWGKILESLPALGRVAEQRPNLTLRTGRLDREAYEALLRSADCLVSTYDPVVYARKTSGVMWEAISLGIPALVPRDTWLQREAALWAAGHVAYAKHEADAICAGFTELAANFDELSARSAEAAARYQRLNGPAALLHQIGAHWAPRLLAARLIIEPEARVLPIEELTGEGLWATETMRGAKVRWTDRVFHLAFDWPYWSRWQVVIEASQATAEEQISAATALIDDTEQTTRSEIEGVGGRIVVSGAGGGEASAAVQLRVVLPWSHRAEGETRDLGVLLSKITLGPDQDGQPGESSVTPLVKVVTPVEWIEAGRTFRMPRIVSGMAVLDPMQGCVVLFDVWTADGPAAARSLAFFADGAPVPLEVTAAADGHWIAQAALPQSADLGGNFAVDWDLAWPGGDGANDMVVGNLRGQRPS
jgi:glycosyltransferase involved in cell wall biosynthesis